MTLKKWIHRTLTVTLMLTSTSAFACRLGEVRAFKNTLFAGCPETTSCDNPLGDWTPANGSLLPINADTTTFYSLYGSYFGGDNIRTFGVPKIPDLILNGEHYAFYVCSKGSWDYDGTGVNSTFIEQHAKITPNKHDGIPMDHVRVVEIDINFDYNIDYFMPRLLDGSSSRLIVPTFNNLAFQIQNGAEGPVSLINYLTEWSKDLPDPAKETDCYEGGIYFSALNRKYSPGNMIELPNEDLKLSMGYGELPARVFLCERPGASQ